MLNLYAWSAGGSRDIMLNKPLLAEVLDKYEVRVIWGCNIDHAPLLEDLDLEVLAVADSGPELQRYCPEGFRPFALASPADDNSRPLWSELVGSFNERASAIGFPMPLTANLTPMIDLPPVDIEIGPDAIYVERGCDHALGLGVIDLEFLSGMFRGLNFYCATPPGFAAHNVIDCSEHDNISLSTISNQCDAIVGTGGEQFICTLTEANRFKQRALVQEGQDVSTYWGDYPGNPLQVVSSREDLLRFLVALDKAPKLDLTHQSWCRG